MKIAFVYNQPDEYWKDGLYAALQILGRKWDIHYFNGTLPKQPTKYDFILVWGAFGSEQELAMANVTVKKGICVAGGPVDHPDIHKFDVVFVETKWHLREFRKRGVNAMLAFGVNTNLFRHIEGVKEQFDYIYPAAFAKWKRHELFVKKPGYKLAVGYMQPSGFEKECYEVCLGREDTVVMPQVTPEVLVWLYSQSGTVYVPADLYGGGERAVLEGLACGCGVEVKNEKLTELLEDMQNKLLTHKDYAESIKLGIEKCLLN